MLDENLPTFFLKASPGSTNQNQSFYLTYRGSEPEPAYNLKKPDPSSPGGKNCYAAALFDSYNPEILYGEVLIQPEWTQPTLSQEEIRRNGGVPPPPQPLLPQEFTVQLYNPDQQVVIRQKPGSWAGAPTYNFSMPQQTFRLPSSSTLDRQHSDPAADSTTPQINFIWKREGKLSKDLACYMTGKSNDVVKKKHKEPDIIVSMFQALREITIYESNYHRIDLEDPKGLEVVLLLSAAVLKEVYFSPLKEAFNVADAGTPGLRKHSSSLTLLGSSKPKPTNSFPTRLAVPAATPVPSMTPPVQPSARPTGSAALSGLYNQTPNVPGRPQHLSQQAQPGPRTSSAPLPPNSHQPPPPPPVPVDPRSQWEINAETARLRAQQDAEKARLQAARKEQERADAAEAKRLRKEMEAQERESRKKQAEIDKETERLRKKYGMQGQAFAAAPPAPNPPPRQSFPPSQSQPLYHQAQARPQQQHVAPPLPNVPRPQFQGWHSGPYLGTPTMSGGAGSSPYGHTPSASTSGFFGNGAGGGGGGGGRKPQTPSNGFVKPKKSFWGLGSSSRDAGTERNLVRRKSTMMF